MTELVKVSNGSYLLRERNGEHVLTLQFRDKPTHHLVVIGPDGCYTINKKQYGAYKTLHEVRNLP